MVYKRRMSFENVHERCEGKGLEESGGAMQDHVTMDADAPLNLLSVTHTHTHTQ
jgi:hypothetical protein